MDTTPENCLIIEVSIDIGVSKSSRAVILAHTRNLVTIEIVCVANRNP
jgi:hypothetical protein